MKEWITEDGGIPKLYPGMLIRTPGDRWIQLTAVDYTHGSTCGHYLSVGPDSRLVITDSVVDRYIPGKFNCGGIKEIYKFLDRHQMVSGDAKHLALPQYALRRIIRGDRGIASVAVWRNPKYSPTKKMTVAEIEKKLGYKIEIISEEK